MEKDENRVKSPIVIDKGEVYLNGIYKSKGPIGYVKQPDPEKWPKDFPENPNEGYMRDWPFWISSLDTAKLAVHENNNYSDSGLMLWIPLAETLKDSTDPVDFIEFFCKCNEWGVYPPVWLMNEISNRFKFYLEGNDTGKDRRRLGEFFGETARGNRPPYFKRRAFKKIMESMCIDIDILNCIFKLSFDDALGIVMTVIDKVENTTDYKFDKGESALEKYYKKEWLKLDRELHLEYNVKLYNQIDNCREFIRKFDCDTVAAFPQLRPYLKD